MCEAVADLARRFHITSVAEGVETTDDLQVLTEIGYDVAQGFLFARPMMTEDFIDLITSRAINKPSPV
jgi:EAL domain-containing protein (putative c-di-GMP-specific phosphodiesterase class I)